MGSKTIQRTINNNLCCGCGACAGICPKECITWERKNGLFMPHIAETMCIGCGLCAAVCPGLGHTYEPKETAVETVTGPVLACFNAWSRDSDLRHVCASGGVISTMIRELLAKGIYDGAFCLDSYACHEHLKTRLYTAEQVEQCWAQSNAPKSRYLPVSHENAVRFMRKNRDKKMIFVGTSCAIRGLRAVVERLNLDADRYLFIGLFCDKVFNYNVLSYFENTYAGGAKLAALHFKNKESGGWPGDMKFFPQKGEAFYVPLEERAKAKAYFMPERCLYCVDKLNACADISLGDNYTGRDDSSLGSNSAIVRTQVGMAAWSAVQDVLETRPIELADIQKAQAIDWRINNMYVGDLAHSEIKLNAGVPRENRCELFRKTYRIGIKKLRTGAIYDTDPSAIKKQIEKDNRKPNPVVQFTERAVGFMKRRLLR